MSEPEARLLLERLDDLLTEVSRQGRAAVAAQAAAESCLTAVQALAAQYDDHDGERGAGDAHDDTLRDDTDRATAARWLGALLPVADAIERAAAQAARLAERRAPPRRGFFRSLFGAAPPDDDGAADALVDGLLVLQAQLHAALADLGVLVDRPLGAPVDPERHRVVAVRPPRPCERPGDIVEVVRPGYALGPALVREAEVIAARGAASEP